MRRAAALLLTAAASLAASAPFTPPLARVTWSHPNGPGLLLGADPRELGLDVGVSELGPFVAVQGEWEAGRVDVGVRSSIDLLMPVAGFAASGSIMKRWAVSSHTQVRGCGPESPFSPSPAAFTSGSGGMRGKNGMSRPA